MLTTVLIVIHIIIAVLLTLIILLQEGDSGGLGGMLGGGNSMFSATGGQSFLTKATTVLAILFVVTSLSIAKLSSNKKSDSLLKEDLKKSEMVDTQEDSDAHADDADNAADTAKDE